MTAEEYWHEVGKVLLPRANGKTVSIPQGLTVEEMLEYLNSFAEQKNA